MASFLVERNAVSGIVKCLVIGFLTDEEAEALAAQLLHQVQISRRAGQPFRLLFDNGQGSVFSAKAAQIVGQLKISRDPRDRTAVIVSDSINKLQAKRNAGEKTHIFNSEADAMKWLAEPDA